MEKPSEKKHLDQAWINGLFFEKEELEEISDSDAISFCIFRGVEIDDTDIKKSLSDYLFDNSVKIFKKMIEDPEYDIKNFKNFRIKVIKKCLIEAGYLEAETSTRDELIDIIKEYRVELSVEDDEDKDDEDDDEEAETEEDVEDDEIPSEEAIPEIIPKDSVIIESEKRIMKVGFSLYFLYMCIDEAVFREEEKAEIELTKKREGFIDFQVNKLMESCCYRLDSLIKILISSITRDRGVYKTFEIAEDGFDVEKEIIKISNFYQFTTNTFPRIAQGRVPFYDGVWWVVVPARIGNNYIDSLPQLYSLKDACFPTGQGGEDIFVGDGYLIDIPTGASGEGLITVKSIDDLNGKKFKQFILFIIPSLMNPYGDDLENIVLEFSNVIKSTHYLISGKMERMTDQIKYLERELETTKASKIGYLETEMEYLDRKEQDKKIEEVLHREYEFKGINVTPTSGKKTNIPTLWIFIILIALFIIFISFAISISYYVFTTRG